MITHKHSRKKKKATEIKETYSQSLTPFCACFPIGLYLLYLLPLLLPSHHVFLRSTIKNPKPYPSSTSMPSVWVCHPLPPCSFSLFLPVPKLELEARHHPERVTCVVTEAIWNRRFSPPPFLPWILSFISFRATCTRKKARVFVLCYCGLSCALHVYIFILYTGIHTRRLLCTEV